MRAFFVTVRVNDAGNLMDAWARGAGYDFENVTFVLRGTPNDDEILDRARKAKADVIFYVGAAAGEGLPCIETLQSLRRLAPSVNLCWDSADPPWHPLLSRYKEAECFDLQVGLDGAHAAPVDLVTLTPVNHGLYEGAMPRTIRCGFTGNIPSRARMEILRAQHGTDEQRAAVLHPLGDLVTIRERVLTGPYEDYVAFLQSCEIAINTSMTGSGATHHVKGRVVEIPLAGAALLEMAAAPTHRWLPPSAFYTYRDPDEASHLIRTLEPDDIRTRAAKAKAYVRWRYHPKIIYDTILSRIGLA